MASVADFVITDVGSGALRVVRTLPDGAVEYEDAKGRRMLAYNRSCCKCRKSVPEFNINPGSVIFRDQVATGWCLSCIKDQREADAIAKEAYHRKRRILKLEECGTPQQRRQSIAALAKPKWRDTKAIKAFYDEAKRLTKETGIVHHVDHYYPLQGIVCCGLHVHHNLRVIPASQNCSKSNEHPMDSSPASENLTFSEERELMRALKAVA